MNTSPTQHADSAIYSRHLSPKKRFLLDVISLNNNNNAMDTEEEITSSPNEITKIITTTSETTTTIIKKRSRRNEEDESVSSADTDSNSDNDKHSIRKMKDSLSINNNKDKNITSSRRRKEVIKHSDNENDNSDDGDDDDDEENNVTLAIIKKRRKSITKNAENLIQSIQSQFNRQECSDIKVNVCDMEGNLIKGYYMHKLILTRCDYFGRMFATSPSSGKFLESSSKEISVRLYDAETMSLEIIEAVFKSLYAMNFEDPLIKQYCLHFNALCRLLLFKEGEIHSLKIINNSIDESSVCEILNYAHGNQMRDLTEKCIQFLKGTLMKSIDPLKLARQIPVTHFIRLMQCKDLIYFLLKPSGLISSYLSICTIVEDTAVNNNNNNNNNNYLFDQGDKEVELITDTTSNDGFASESKISITREQYNILDAIMKKDLQKRRRILHGIASDSGTKYNTATKTLRCKHSGIFAYKWIHSNLQDNLFNNLSRTDNTVITDINRFILDGLQWTIHMLYEVKDMNVTVSLDVTIEVTKDYIEEYLGEDYTDEDIARMLKRKSFELKTTVVNRDHTKTSNLLKARLKPKYRMRIPEAIDLDCIRNCFFAADENPILYFKVSARVFDEKITSNSKKKKKKIIAHRNTHHNHSHGTESRSNSMIRRVI